MGQWITGSPDHNDCDPVSAMTHMYVRIRIYINTYVYTHTHTYIRMYNELSYFIYQPACLPAVTSGCAMPMPHMGVKFLGKVHAALIKRTIKI